jgi:uncharacterized cupredoxin-like copper-binding protein
MTNVRMVPRLGGALCLALGLFVPTAVVLADAPQQIAMEAVEYGFVPSTVKLVVGQPVQLTINNTGFLAHDLKTEMPISQLTYIQADNDPQEQQDNVAQGVLDVDFSKGDTAQVTFVPTTAGTYPFTCDLAGHTEAGMKGVFVVTGP